MSELLSYAETQKLLDDLDDEQQKLVSDLVPAQITVGGIQRVLQNLLAERVSIRDLPTILEGVFEASGFSRQISAITEHVRARLARQISNAQLNGDGIIPMITLSPEWEQSFAESIVGDGEERQLAMAPSRLQEFIAAVRQVFERQAMMGESPILLTSPGIRPYVRSIVGALPALHRGALAKRDPPQGQDQDPRAAVGSRRHAAETVPWGHGAGRHAEGARGPWARMPSSWPTEDSPDGGVQITAALEDEGFESAAPLGETAEPGEPGSGRRGPGLPQGAAEHQRPPHPRHHGRA